MMVYVVSCVQHYANHFSVCGVFATRELAAQYVKDNGGCDFEIEEFVLRDAKWNH